MNPALYVLLLWQQTQQIQQKLGFLLFLKDPAKLGKVGLFAGFIKVSWFGEPIAKQNPGLTWIEPSYINTRVISIFKTAVQRCSVKKLLLEILQNSLKNTCV